MAHVPQNLLAVLFALASAFIIAWGTVVRHRISSSATADGTAQNSPLMTALARPMWWVATGTALLAYGLQIVALGFGTLLIVQPILVLSLMFTLLLAARDRGDRVHSHEVLWAGILTASVTVLVLFGRPMAGDARPPLERWLLALVVGIVVLGGLTYAARGRQRPRRALFLGLVTGALFGGVAVLSKAFVEVFKADGVLGIITGWQTYALIAMAALGTAVQQYAFHAGRLSQSLPAMTVAEPLVAFTMGYLVLGERFQVQTALGWLIMALALAGMVVSTTRLSRV